MANLIPFEAAKLPSYLQAALPPSDDLGVGGGFPTISIKGKVFHIKRGDEKTLVCKPGEDEPAGSIEVVILKAGPAGGANAKVFYAKGYTEGDDAKPTCYSNDGIAPAADAEEQQAAKCAICPRNVWGSKISENGKETKECQDSKRLAVAQIGAINDPLLLRVPAASLKALREFGDLVKKRGFPYQAVVTKIGFDYTVAHPALTFKPVGFVDEATFEEVQSTIASDIVLQIVGGQAMQARPKLTNEQEFEQKAEVAKPAPKPAKAKPAPVEAAVEAKPEPKPAPKPAPVVKEVEETDIESGLSAALDDLDFDD